MFLVVVGSFDVEEIMTAIRDNQKNKEFEELEEIKVKEFKEKDEVYKKEEIIESTTSIPKVALTIKMPIKDIKLSRRELSLYLYILFTSMFDETSSFDEELKKDKIITNTTYVSTLNAGTHMLISIINETNKYKEFIKRVEVKLNDISINEEDFNRKKKVLISNEIFAYEYAEQINDIILDDILYTGKVEDNPIEVIDSLKIDVLNDLIKKIDSKNISKIILKNKDNY